jgi:adenylate cyclase class 2
MLEAEVKLALDDASASALRARLDALGAAAGATLVQTDTYFAHPERDFRTTDEALRLRSEGDVLRVTYKGPKLDPPRKTREEIEFAIAADHATATTLLERLGFRPAAVVRKRRVEFDLRGDFGATIAIDEVDGLGTFCEIEVAAGDVAEGRARLQDTQDRLGLGALAPIAESYLELLTRHAR